VESKSTSIGVTVRRYHLDVGAPATRPHAPNLAQGDHADLSGFAEIVAAIRSGVVYVNIHTTKFPSGELRAQLKDDD